MSYFSNCADEDSTKLRYKQLAKLNYGDGPEMQRINAAYEERLRVEFRKRYTAEIAERFVDLERNVAVQWVRILGLEKFIVEAHFAGLFSTGPERERWIQFLADAN